MDRKLNPDNIYSATIGQSATLWPESRAYAFKIGDHDNQYYFRLADPERVKNEGISCRVKCLKFIKSSGEIFITNLTVKTNMEIKPLTIKGFVDMVSSKYRELKDNPNGVDLTLYLIHDLTGNKA